MGGPITGIQALSMWIGEGKCMCRWLGLKVWELSEYDAILLLDVHMTVKMDISPIFQLPTDFATTLDQEWGRYR